MYQSILNTFGLDYFFGDINLIFEPFPKVVIKFVLEDQDIPMVSIPQDCWQKVEEFTAIYPEAVLLGNSDC